MHASIVMSAAAVALSYAQRQWPVLTAQCRGLCLTAIALALQANLSTQHAQGVAAMAGDVATAKKLTGGQLRWSSLRLLHKAADTPNKANAADNADDTDGGALSTMVGDKKEGSNVILLPGGSVGSMSNKPLSYKVVGGAEGAIIVSLKIKPLQARQKPQPGCARALDMRGAGVCVSVLVVVPTGPLPLRAPAATRGANEVRPASCSTGRVAEDETGAL